MNTIKYFTIGVYGSNEDIFFKKLQDNKIDVFCDIRQRRGVRGSKYSYVNSKKLQTKLKELGINYLHISELAPTKAIREIQKDQDKVNNENKSQRTSLGETFIKEYKTRILDNFNFDQFEEKLKNIRANRVVLFCVEEKPEACHRSIVALKIKDLKNHDIVDL